MTTGGQTYYLTYDQVGSLLAVADANGNVVKEVTYDSFGNILSDSRPTLVPYFAFAGGLRDADTWLVRLGYRDYDPEVGRWTAKDPIGFEGSQADLYGYCFSDSINHYDYSGLESDGFWGFPSEEKHLNRNKHNVCPRKKPEKNGNTCDPWQKDLFEDKFRHPNGSECVYDNDGNLLPDKNGNYTFNFTPNKYSPVHIWEDVVPHFYYGHNYTPNLTTASACNPCEEKCD